MSKEDFVPFKNEKEIKFKKSIKSILKITKKKKVSNALTNEIKQEIIKKINKKEINDFKFAFLFILFYSKEFEEIKIKIKNEEINTSKLKENSFWKNPSKNLLIFFNYTFLYEKFKKRMDLSFKDLENKDLKTIIEYLKNI